MSEIDKEKENFSFEHSNFFSDKIISANLIRSIWLFNISPSIFYLGVLDPKKSLSIIDSIFGYPPPIRCKRGITETQYNWLAHCLRKLIAPKESTKFDEYKLFLSYLYESRGNYVENIKRFLSIRYLKLKNYTSKSNGNNVDQSPSFFDSEGDEMIIFKHLYELYTEQPALFFSFRKCHYDQKLETFTTENSTSNNSNSNQLLPLLPDHFTFSECEARLIAKFGNRLLECCPSISPILLRALKNEDLESLFGLPSIYSNSKCIETAIQFQKAFFSIRRFPLVSFFANSSSLVALFNTSAVTSQHFVDLFMKPAVNYVERSEFKESVKICGSFPEMADYASLLAMDKERKIDDTNFMSHVISIHFEGPTTESTQISSTNSLSFFSTSISFSSDSLTSHPSTASPLIDSSPTCSSELLNELFQRFKGDVCVIDDIKNYLGTLTSLAKLREESFPRIFVSFLRNENYEPFDTMRARILFSVKDEDWIHDSDFVSGYFALVNTMKALETNEESYFERIEFHILEIASSDFLNTLSTEIFSLLFLTKPKEEEDDDGKKSDVFFVSKMTAERILRILIDSDNSDDENNTLLNYLSSALRKLQYANVLFPDEQTVRAIMEPIEGMFALALEQKEIGIFTKIAHSDAKEGSQVKLKEIVEVAKQVFEFQQKNNKDDETKFNELNNESKIEIVNSFELSQNELKKLCSGINVNESSKELQALLSQKKEIKESTTEFLQFPFENLYSSNFFKRISEQLSNSSLEKEKSWNRLLTNEDDLTNANSSTFYSFLSNLDTLLPPLLQATNETAAKCLDFDPLIAVPQLVNDGKIEQASSLARSLGYSVSEAIIRSKSTSHQCLSLLCKENPVLSSCLILNSDVKKDEVSDEFLGNSQALLNYFSKRVENEFQSCDQIFDSDLKNQGGASMDEMHSNILSLMKIKPFPLSQLSDILFRVYEDDFISITMSSKVFFNYEVADFEQFLKLCELNGFEKFGGIIENFIELFKLINRKPFPLEQSFSTLILNSPHDSKSFSIANSIYKECKSFFNCSKAIQSAIVELYNREKYDDIVQIIEFNFVKKTELFESLPKNIFDSISSRLHSSCNSRNADLIDKSANLDDSAFFDSVPISWNLMETPIETVIKNAADTQNALRLISSFPFIQEQLNESMLQFISSDAQVNEIPIEKRAMSIASKVRSFLKLMKDSEQKKNLVDLAFKELVLLTTQLSAYDSHSELTMFNSLKRIYASMNSIRAESRKHKIEENRENIEILNCLSAALNFVGYFPYTKFNIQYNFSEFLNKKTGEVIVKSSFQLDLIETAKEAADAWNVDGYDNLKDEYAVKCANIGIDKIPLRNKYKGFPVRPKSDSEKVDDHDETFSIWKIATDRKSFDVSLCTSEDSFKVVRQLVDAYRHRSFYDARICGRLTDLAAVDAILYSEFKSSEMPPPPPPQDQQQQQQQEEQADEFNGANISASSSKGGILATTSYSGEATRKSYSIFGKIFKSKRKQLSAHSSSSFDISKFVDDDGELSNQHFTSRLNHICVSDLETDNESTDDIGQPQPPNYLPSNVAEAFAIGDHPSTDMSERLFPGTPAQLSSYLSARAPFYEEARYHSSIGEFFAAFTILEERLKGDSEDDLKCFIEDLFMPALERGRTGSFFCMALQLLKGNKAKNSPVRLLIESLLELSQKVDYMPFTEIGCLICQSRLKLAVFTAIHNIRSIANHNVRLHLIDLAFASAATLINNSSSCIENPEDIEKVEKYKAECHLFKKDSKGEKLILDVIDLLHIQHKFDERLDGDLLNIFEGEESVNKMIAYLILKGEFLIAAEFAIKYPDCYSSSGVASNLADNLANNPEQKVVEVISGMESSLPMKMFRGIVVEVVKRVLFNLKEEGLVEAIIGGMKPSELKCSLLILSRKLEEAFNVASEAAPDFLPLIAHYAGREGKLQIVTDAVRIIEKNEKKHENRS